MTESDLAEDIGYETEFFWDLVMVAFASTFLGCADSEYQIQRMGQVAMIRAENVAKYKDLYAAV